MIYYFQLQDISCLKNQFHHRGDLTYLLLLIGLCRNISSLGTKFWKSEFINVHFKIKVVLALNKILLIQGKVYAETHPLKGEN